MVSRLLKAQDEKLMTVVSKEIGPHRYRESFGRYFDDFMVGDVYEHRPGRTISEVDNTWFTLLTMNTHPVHFDQNYAADSEFGRILVNSCLTLSVVVELVLAISVNKRKPTLAGTISSF